MAFYNGNANQDGDGYWNTTRNVFRYWDETPLLGDFRDLSLPHWLTDVLSETGTWIWLGYSDNKQDLLDQIDLFSAGNVYVGVVNDNMVQLTNTTFVAEVNGRDVWGWIDLVAGSGTSTNTPKNISVNYNIGEGHDVDDTSANANQGNIYRVERDGQIEGFSMWANPLSVDDYQGFIQRVGRYGDEDYRLAAGLREADDDIMTTGAGVLELSYEYSTPLVVSEGEYLWVGVSVGNGGARGRQQADATVNDVSSNFTFVDHSKFNGTPDTDTNVWHMNPDNYSYRQEIRGTFVSTDELVVEQNGILAYVGASHIDFETENSIVASQDKVTLMLESNRVIVSEDDPPDAADVATEDLTKLYFHITANGVIRSVSYILDVDPHIFNLTSVQFQPVTEIYRGFRLDGNYGYLVPRRNIIIMEHTTGTFPLLNLQFEQGVTEPFDYTSYGAGLTLYRRLKGNTGNWGHHNLVRDNTDHYNFQASTDGGFFGSNSRYDVILRLGQFGDGASATVPAANRLEPYPGGLKREYIPQFDQIDSITRLYDVVRESGLNDGVVDDVTLGLASSVLTVTLSRTIGDDIVGTVTLPASASDGVVDTATMSVDASDVLTLTLARTVGVDVTATVTLPDTSTPSTVLPRFRAPLATKTVATALMDTTHLNAMDDYGWQCNRKRRVHP